MNALLPLFGLEQCSDKAANTLAAARALVPHLNRSRALDRTLVAGVMLFFSSFFLRSVRMTWRWASICPPASPG